MSLWRPNCVLYSFYNFVHSIIFTILFIGSLAALVNLLSLECFFFSFVFFLCFLLLIFETYGIELNHRKFFIKLMLLVICFVKYEMSCPSHVRNGRKWNSLHVIASYSLSPHLLVIIFSWKSFLDCMLRVVFIFALDLFFMLVSACPLLCSWLDLY